jgi:MYXO-CTERM domain-containing protein
VAPASRTKVAVIGSPFSSVPVIVPEPGAGALALVAAGALAALRRRA